MRLLAMLVLAATLASCSQDTQSTTSPAGGPARPRSGPDLTSGLRVPPGERFIFAGGQADGFTAFATNEGPTTITIVAEIDAALRSQYPADPPDFIGRIPHGYHDPARIEADVRAAGFSKVRIETITHVARVPSARAAAVAWCQGTPMRSEIEARGGPLDAVTDRVAEALERNRGTGPVESAIQALIVTAEG